MPKLTMLWGVSIKSMARWAMTLRSLLGKGWMDEKGTRSSPAGKDALSVIQCNARQARSSC